MFFFYIACCSQCYKATRWIVKKAKHSIPMRYYVIIIIVIIKTNKQTLQQTIFGFGKAVVNCEMFTRRSFPNTRQTRVYKTFFEISYESAFEYFARSCVKRTFTRNLFVEIRYFVSGEKRRIRVAHVFVLGWRLATLKTVTFVK